MNENQTISYVIKMRHRLANHSYYLTLPRIIEYLNYFEKDINIYQSAENAFKDGKDATFVLAQFIRNFGKLLFLLDEPHNGFSIKNRWGITGENFILGCPIPNYPSFTDEYSSEYGIYEPNCGLNDTYVSYGHNEYLYQVLTNPVNENMLPQELLYCIRYNNLNLHHQENAYEHLLNNYDRRMLPFLREFNKYDFGEEELVSDSLRNKYEFLWSLHFKNFGLYL